VRLCGREGGAGGRLSSAQRIHERRLGAWGALMAGVAGFLSLSSCASFREPWPDAAQIPEPLEDGKGRVLLDETRVRFELEDGEPVAIERQRRVVQIEGPRSKGLADLSVYYDRTFTRVVEARVRARYPDGSEKKWGKDDGHDMPLFGGSILYTDSRGLFIDVPAAPAGTIVEHVSETRQRPAQHFTYGGVFQERIPVEHKRVIVDFPSDWDIEWIAERLGARIEAPPTKSERDGRVELAWQRENLAPLRVPAHGPPFDEVADLVLLRVAAWMGGDGVKRTEPRDHKEQARFDYELTKARAVRSPALEAEVKKALRGVPDEPRAKARRLYAWVRDSVRYCAVEVGMGGWIPHEAPVVLDARAGDCKDKANLLKTMLEVAGVESHLVIIYSGAWPRRYRLPVLAANFNHAILAIDLPEGRVFVDPTSRTAAFSDLPPGDEDRLALLADAKGTGLVPMPASSPDSDLRADRYDLTLRSDGTAHGTFESSLGGAFADEIRRRLLHEPKKRHDDVANAMIAIMFPRVAEAGLTFGQAAPPEEPVPVTVRGTLTLDLVRALEPRPRIVLRTSSFFGSDGISLDDQEEDEESERTVPILLGHRYRDQSVLRLRLPPSLRVASVPPDVLHESPWASYQRRAYADDDGRVLVLERSVTSKERIVPAADAAEYRAWAAAAFLADEAAIVLVGREP
jgi:transglutaminase-like putative cysteine protease